MRVPNLLVFLISTSVSWAPAQIFQSTGQVTAGSSSTQPVFLCAGDFNRDGLPDFAVHGGATTSAWFSNGPGSYAGVPLSVSNVVAMEVGDVDGDGRLDLVFAVDTGTSSVRVMLGNGNQFAPPVSYPTTPGVRGMTVADFNGDGKLDVATLHDLADLVAVMFNNGTGSLLAPVTYPLLPNTTLGLEAADIDGDADVDIVTCTTSNEFGVLLNNGSGGFQPVAPRPGPPQTVQVFQLADMNHDGVADIVWSCAIFVTTPGVGVMLNNGSGSFTPAGFHQIVLVLDPSVVGDFNGDGHADVASPQAITDDGGILVLYGDGQGNLTSEFVDTQRPIRGLACADFDLDGRQDVFAVAHRLLADRHVLFMHNTSLQPTGLLRFGQGTQACAGTIALTGNSLPRVGNAQFALLSANAPANSLGLVMLAMTPDIPGSDPLGLGVTLHVALGGGVVTGAFLSGPGGTGFAPAPIPANAALAAKTFYLQGLWLEMSPGYVCTTSSYGLVSSRGLSLTIQP